MYLSIKVTGNKEVKLLFTNYRLPREFKPVSKSELVNSLMEFLPYSVRECKSCLDECGTNHITAPTKEDLAAIDRELFGQLKQLVRVGNMRSFEALIQSRDELDPHLVQGLLFLAYNFELNTLYELFLNGTIDNNAN